jgi:hypothetical protein
MFNLLKEREMKGWRIWGIALLTLLGMIGCNSSSDGVGGLKFTEGMLSGTTFYQRFDYSEYSSGGEGKTTRNLVTTNGKTVRDVGEEESPNIAYLRIAFLPDHTVVGQSNDSGVEVAPGLTWRVENGKLLLESDAFEGTYITTLQEKDETRWVITDGNYTFTWHLQQKFTPEMLRGKTFATEDSSYLYRFDETNVILPQEGEGSSDIVCAYEIDEKGELLINGCGDGSGSSTSQTHKIYRMPLEIFEEEFSGNNLAVWNDTNETDTAAYFGYAEDLWTEFVP